MKHKRLLSMYLTYVMFSMLILVSTACNMSQCLERGCALLSDSLRGSSDLTLL